MSRDNYEEFPELTPEANAAYVAALAAFPNALGHSCATRRAFSAFLQEAMKQARPGVDSGAGWACLYAISRSLYSPPPPPPTLAQAREADLDTPAGRDLVRDFLANLATETQP